MQKLLCAEKIGEIFVNLCVFVALWQNNLRPIQLALSKVEQRQK